MLLVLAAIVAAVPAWRALERHLVLRAAGASPLDVRRGYVALERNPAGVLHVVPGHRAPQAVR